MSNLAQKLSELGRTAAHPSNQSTYQPRQQSLKFPKLPEFTMFVEERQHRKKRLVTICRAFVLYNLDHGSTGHLTVCDPELPELCWTNPMAVHFSQVKLSNLILADHNGKIIEGSYALNRAGLILHAAVHEANSDTTAMYHAHTVYGTVFVTLGRPLDPVTQDAAVFFKDHVVIKDEAGAVAAEERAGTSICDHFKNVKAATHQNHGLLTVSRHSIEAAAFWFIALKCCCQQQLLVEATGVKPMMVSEYSSRYSREHVSSEYIGRLHFQPIYEQLVQTNLDMFD